MIINVSENKDYFSQRNNFLKPMESCNVTSMVMALHYLGYTFPKGIYSQPEDNLRAYIESKGMNPEIHDQLSKGTNEWIGKRVTEFKTNIPIPTIIDNILIKKPVVLSGTFPGYPTRRTSPLGHIVTLVGLEWKDQTPEGQLDQPIAVIIDDPYGNTMNSCQGKGNDIKISWNLFIEWMKPCGNTSVKWGHLFL